MGGSGPSAFDDPLPDDGWPVDPLPADRNPGQPVACADWGEVVAWAADQGGGPRAVRLAGDAERRLRAALTAHADAVPGHEFERLGDAAAIDRVEAIPAYQARLRAVYECRRVERRGRPHDGSAVPAATASEASLDPWRVELPPPGGFEPTPDEHEVPGSAAVETCRGCGGAGDTACEKCSGAKEVRCGRCGGSGSVNCSECVGRGECKRVTGKIPRKVPCICGFLRERERLAGRAYVCSQCNNVGEYERLQDVESWVPCRCGSGKVCCPECRGRQKVGCGGCRATGRVPCNPCGRSGRVVSFLAVARTFAPGAARHLVADPGVPGDIVARLGSVATFDRLLDLRTTAVPPRLDLAEETPAAAAVVRVFAESLAGCPAGHRVTAQQLVVEAAPAYRVGYGFAGRGYSAWWADLPGRPPLVPITSPLADAAGGLVNEALRLWSDGDRREAALTLQDAARMATADPRCRAALDARRADVPPELWALAGRAFSPTRLVRRGWTHLRRRPVVLALLGAVLGLTVLAAGAVGYRVVSGHVAARRQAAEARAILRLDGAEPIRAADLAAGMRLMYHSGTAAAEYGGRPVVVIGAGAHTSDRTVFLEAGRRFETVDCEFAVREDRRAAGLRRGQEVVLRGTIRVYPTAAGGEWFTLEGCELVSAGKPPPVPPGPATPIKSSDPPAKPSGLPAVEVRFTDTFVSAEAGGTTKLRVRVGSEWEPHDAEVVLRFEAPAALILPGEIRVPRGQLEAEVPLTVGDRPGKYLVRLVPVGLRNRTALMTTATITVTERPAPTPMPEPPPRAALPPKTALPVATDRLGEQHLPHRAGNVWLYDTTSLAGTDAGSVMRTEVAHKADGRLEVRRVKAGRTDGKGGVRWAKDLNDPVVPQQLQTRNGFVEVGTPDGPAEPMLKLDARKGDSWDWVPPGGGLYQYEVVRADALAARPIAVVKVTQTGSGVVVTETRTFVHGVGEVERVVEVSRGGPAVVVSRRRLVEP
jgi:hypothetical protein